MKAQFGGRSGGKTLALVADARDGDALIVSHGGERDHVRHLLHGLGRHPDALRVIVMFDDDPIDKLRGRPRDRRVYVDHAAATIGSDHAARWFCELERIAEDRFGGLHFYPVAEPCDTGCAGSPHSAESGREGISHV